MVADRDLILPADAFILHPGLLLPGIRAEVVHVGVLILPQVLIQPRGRVFLLVFLHFWVNLILILHVLLLLALLEVLDSFLVVVREQQARRDRYVSAQRRAVLVWACEIPDIRGSNRVLAFFRWVFLPHWADRVHFAGVRDSVGLLVSLVDWVLLF